MELETRKTLDETRQAEILTNLAEYRRVAETDNRADIERMVTADDFFNGYQWDLTQKQDMEDQGKYCATIPLIRPQVAQLVGNVVANPKDISVLNTHGGMKVLADAQTTLLKHAIESCQGQDLMVQWFQRGAVTGKGYLGWFVDWDTDPMHGNLVIRNLDEFDCLSDPTCSSYDMNGSPGTADGARFFLWDEWVDQSWAAKRWPDVAELFGAQPAGVSGKLYQPITQGLYGVVGRDNERVSTRSPQTVPDYGKLRYKLTHSWWVEWRDAWYWYDTRKSELDALILTDKAEIRRARKVTERHSDVYRMVRSMVKVVNHTLTIGGVFLENYVDEFGLAQANLAAIPVVGFSAMWDTRKHCGIVDDMIGPQETFNWLRSFVVNLLKLMPNTGWKITKDMDGYADYLRTHTGEAAQIIDLSKCGGMAEKIEPSTFPAGLDLISDKSKGEIRECSNIRTENPEQDTQQQSGRAILAKQANSQTGISPVLKNYDWSLRIFGNLGVNIIRCSGCYSDDEIKAMIEESGLIDDEMLHQARVLVVASLGIAFPEDPPIPNPASFMPPAGQKGAPQPPQGPTPEMLNDIGKLYVEQKQTYEALMGAIDEIAKPMAIQTLIDALRNPIAGRYHCTVALSPYSLTERLHKMVNLAETNQLLIASGSQPLSDKYILKASDLANKEEILKDRGYS